MVMSSIYIRLILYNTYYILYYEETGPKSKFTDGACPNEACKDYGVAGHGNIIGNGTYQSRNNNS